MKRLTTFGEFRAYVRNAARPQGLVPTMGALHEGHLSLIRHARADCATVVATIFVNPAQFAPGEDLAIYPRPLEHDLELLDAEGVDAAFTPEVAEVYPSTFATSVEVQGPALPLEGVYRPGHLRGVATVVAKLLTGALPDRAYFGQKDGQQLAVVRRLVADLSIPVEVIAVPTVRERDGLAASSRNAALSPEQLAAAPVVFRALQAGAQRHAGGERQREVIEAACRDVLEAEPRLSAIDYVALVDPDAITPWSGDGPGMLAAAVRFGTVRLIDNVLLA